MQIRIMFGNGLRPQIWEQFQTRFNIPKITEFYGATEGNTSISKYSDLEKIFISKDMSHQDLDCWELYCSQVFQNL